MRKVALVTGGSRGIGKATVVEFAKKGYDVVINYLVSDDRASALQKEVQEQYGVRALAVKADVSDEKAVKQMVETVIDEFGHIDCLVNNAGIAIDTLFEDKTVIHFRKTLDINLIGTFLVSKYVGKYMIEHKTGSIINVSSTNGIDTFYPMSLDYDASKAGMISLTHNLALQYAPYIRVNSIAPGWVLTDMNQELDEEFIEKECSHILANRFADPSEIARVIVFLSSDDASYINNEVIRVDGGWK
ncbi:MAG: SDR family oxidoreductase [bacterium]|nr:SDR family oxidoreductase [bacterium]